MKQSATISMLAALSISMLILCIYSQPRMAMAEEVKVSKSISSVTKILLTMAPDEKISIDYIDKISFGSIPPPIVKPATVMFNKVTIKGSRQAVNGEECTLSVSIPVHIMDEEIYNPLTIQVPDGETLVVDDNVIDKLPDCFKDPNTSRFFVMAVGSLEIEFLGPEDYIAKLNENSINDLDIVTGYSILDRNNKTITASHAKIPTFKAGKF